MRFYYLTFTILLQVLNLVAQPTDAVKLSSEQIALIKNQGATGIQTVYKESKIEAADLPSIEAFALEVTSSQLTKYSTENQINELASLVTISFAEIADSENIDISYAIEYASAGIARGLANSLQNNNAKIFQAISEASKGAVNGAIDYSSDIGPDIFKIVSAVGSGFLAGIIEASNFNNLDIVEAVEACSNGLIFGTINSTLKNNIEIYETLSSTCEGIAEAAIEASVREQLDLIQQITAASVGAGASAVQATAAFSLDIDQTKKAILEGLKRGTFDSIPGKGNNIRIMITPQKDLIANDLVKTIKLGILDGGIQNGFFPIIETPFQDDPVLRQVSPVN